jgi:hypothetical protein
MLLALPDTPGCINDVTERLVPELQRRGRYRTRYPGTTLRESLQEYGSSPTRQQMMTPQNLMASRR